MSDLDMLKDLKGFGGTATGDKAVERRVDGIVVADGQFKIEIVQQIMRLPKALDRLSGFRIGFQYPQQSRQIQVAKRVKDLAGVFPKVLKRTRLQSIENLTDTNRLGMTEQVVGQQAEETLTVFAIIQAVQENHRLVEDI